MSVLVLGVGNILLEDEGIGVHVVQALSKRYAMPADVEVIDGGTSGMDLLDSIANREHLIIVDAVRTGDAPGTVVRLGSDEVPAFFRSKISPHQLGLSDLLAALELMEQSPKALTLIGVVPVRMGTGLGLSRPIAAKLDELVEMTVAELEAIGRAPAPMARTDTHG